MLVDRVANITPRKLLDYYLRKKEYHNLDIEAFLKSYFSDKGADKIEFHNLGESCKTTMILEMGVQSVEKSIPRWIYFFRDGLGTDSVRDEYQVIMALYDLGMDEVYSFGVEVGKGR